MTAAKLNLHTIFLAAEISLQQIKMQRSRETLRLPRVPDTSTSTRSASGDDDRHESDARDNLGESGPRCCAKSGVGKEDGRVGGS